MASTGSVSRIAFPAPSRVHAAQRAGVTVTSSPSIARPPPQTNRRCVRTAASKSPKSIVDLLKRANDLYTEFDSDKDGELGLDETVTLLNSDVYRETFRQAGFEVPKRSAADIQEVFTELDKDRSGCLSRQEFVGLWAALAKDRLADPRTVALGLCTFLDSNGDGKLQVSELKAFLPVIMGAKGLALAALPVPDFISVEYRTLLGDPNK